MKLTLSVVSRAQRKAMTQNLVNFVGNDDITITSSNN